MTADPTPAELLAIIERAREDKRRREALDLHWQTLAKNWPCVGDRRCMAQIHDDGCVIAIGEQIQRSRK